MPGFLNHGKRMMSPDDNDDNFFSQAMSDVKPIKQEKRVALKKDAPSALSREASRAAAVAEKAVDDNYLSEDYVELLDPYVPLEFKRPGVQHGVFRKLKQGRYQQDARLDLHRMTVEKARHEVFEFIKQSRAYDLRTVTIVHGKGSHGQADAANPKPALLKSYVNKWLQEIDDVQAFCSAQKAHGGVGAVYVLLRKSENKKQENRDRLSKGRTV